MDEQKRYLLDYFSMRFASLMDNYVMAINGAFFTTRRAGYTPSQYQIENAKNFVANAHYLFLEAAGNTLEQIASNLDAQEVAYNMFELEHVKNQLVSISIDMLRQANRAISTGIQNKAIELLGKNNAHGAMGLLVQKKMAELEITATDSAGRKWREPSSLVKTIVRDFIYQSLVDHQIKTLHESGIDLIAVPDIDKPVSIQGQAGYVALKDVRHHFHPNGYDLPVGYTDVHT
ncbi:hypothetical protein J7D37_18205 (plasmid) [Acinetobacter baumannii]|uniref:hypothetical protein n=1 Tax=Acinetobacter baumannii TaxID=470 RepID=UPI00148C318D|nr:hypothetical protein [Acinetobacter baumannii]EHU1307661.1 hypothetical protein [Acinetobacter baumannii]EHU2441315.1 hypothetical protein [Acinetobacter baumannii]EJB5621348.1 hypothetical protein [Acinetobacter baumannii]EKX5556343.1 hypothetical protein [Acinetobacter baumannii]EKX6155484.1 hypothetical protein [Acinetobacter baumannii]